MRFVATILEKSSTLSIAVNFVPQRYWQQKIEVCVSFARFQKSPTRASRGRSLFCDGFGISDLGFFFGLKLSTLLGHGGVLPPFRAQSSLLDELLCRG